MLAAIRAGMDPTLAAAQTRSIQADLAAAEKVVRRAQPTDSRLTPLTENDVRNALGEAESLIKLLGGADRTDRTALYRALGLSLRYQKEAATGLERVQARLQLTRSGGSVLVQDIGDRCLRS